MTPILEAKNIELIVKSREIPVLASSNLTILPGEFIVILGHNGSGKSSLVKILSGDRVPSLGEVLINGKKLSELSNKIRAQKIVTITQNPHDRLFLELTLEENTILWEERFGSIRENKQNLLSYDKIFAHKSFYKDSLVSTLSGGEKQAFLLSLVLAHPPSILFLDEHTSALDPKAAIEVMRLTNQAVKDNNITTIMVTHRLEDAAKYGNRIIIMNEGVITYDAPKVGNLSINDLKNMM